MCVYGKPEGAGTGVTLSNTHYAGLGVPIPYDAGTGLCGSVSIRGLVPNESYVSLCDREWYTDLRTSEPRRVDVKRGAFRLEI